MALFDSCMWRSRGRSELDASLRDSRSGDWEDDHELGGRGSAFLIYVSGQVSQFSEVPHQWQGAKGVAPRLICQQLLFNGHGQDWLT